MICPEASGPFRHPLPLMYLPHVQVVMSVNYNRGIQGGTLQFIDYIARARKV